MEADFRPFLEISYHFSFFALWMRHSASSSELKGVFVGDTKLPDEEMTESASYPDLLLFRKQINFPTSSPQRFCHLRNKF